VLASLPPPSTGTQAHKLLELGRDCLVLTGIQFPEAADDAPGVDRGQLVETGALRVEQVPVQHPVGS